MRRPGRRGVSRAPVPALVPVLATLLAGCTLTQDDSPETAPDDAEAEAGAVEVVEWGVVDGLVSVRLRHAPPPAGSGRILRRAEAVITVRLTDGSSLGAGPRVEGDRCCTVLDLPPGGEFGIYADLGKGPGRDPGVTEESVVRVDVRLDDVEWAPADAPAPPAPTASGAELTQGRAGAEVLTEITVREDVPLLAGQAWLTGPDGEFLAVVSGRFRCFEAGRPRRVRMELFHPVPEGTTVESVIAYPISDAAIVAGEGGCSG